MRRTLDNKKSLETLCNTKNPTWEIGTQSSLLTVTTLVPEKRILLQRLLLSLIKWWVAPKSKIQPLSLLFKVEATKSVGEDLEPYNLEEKEEPDIMFCSL